MKGLRVARIVASVIALMIAGASPHAAAPQQSAPAATSRPGPTPSEIAQVRGALAEYRKAWTSELDGETRAIAVRYGAPTPDDLDRMFRDWMAGGIALMPELPGGVTGKLADAFKLMPNKTPVNPAVKPGMELPDFAQGAAPEALQTLKDAKESYDETRDKHAEAASCSPEAQSAKQALQAKLQAYRQALTDLDAARQQVTLANGAGDTLELATLFGGAANAVKSTADAAMELFGAAAGFLPGAQKGMEGVGALYSAANSGIAAYNAIKAGTPDQVAEAGAVISAAKALSTVLPDNTPLNLALAAGDVGTKLIETSRLRDDKTIDSTRRDLETVGSAAQIAGTGFGALGELPGTTLPSRVTADDLKRSADDLIQRTRKGDLKHTTDYKVETGNTLKTTGAVFSAVGTVISTSSKYDRELGKAFDTIAAGKDEAREYNALNAASLRQSAAKRVEFMEKIAALEAEIGRSSCVK